MYGTLYVECMILRIYYKCQIISLRFYFFLLINVRQSDISKLHIAFDKHAKDIVRKANSTHYTYFVLVSLSLKKSMIPSYNIKRRVKK